MTRELYAGAPYSPPGDGGDRPLPLVKYDLVMAQPALLVQEKLSRRAARNERLLLPAHAGKQRASRHHTPPPRAAFLNTFATTAAHCRTHGHKKKENIYHSAPKYEHRLHTYIQRNRPLHTSYRDRVVCIYRLQ